MTTITSNYGLKKPVQDDFYNVDDFNHNSDIVDTELKRIDDKTSSLKTSDIKFPDGKTVETKLIEVDGEINELKAKDDALSTQMAEKANKDGTVQVNLNAQKLNSKTATAIPATTEKTDIVGMINEVFTSANNLKSDWASVVGSPLVATDTSAQLKSKTQTIKNTLAANLTNKGVTATGTETLSSLATKVNNMPGKINLNGFLNNTVVDSIQTPTSTRNGVGLAVSRITNSHIYLVDGSYTSAKSTMLKIDYNGTVIFNKTITSGTTYNFIVGYSDIGYVKFKQATYATYVLEVYSENDLLLNTINITPADFRVDFRCRSIKHGSYIYTCDAFKISVFNLSGTIVSNFDIGTLVTSSNYFSVFSYFYLSANNNFICFSSYNSNEPNTVFAVTDTTSNTITTRVNRIDLNILGILGGI